MFTLPHFIGPPKGPTALSQEELELPLQFLNQKEDGDTTPVFIKSANLLDRLLLASVYNIFLNKSCANSNDHK